MDKCHPVIASFCKKWGVAYHETDMWVGTLEILDHLQHVSDEFFEEFVTDFPAM